jgi:thiamine-monophosphate kinase
MTLRRANGTRPIGGCTIPGNDAVSEPPPARVADLGEFGLIDRVTRRLAGGHRSTGAAILVGPGDDAAVVAAPDGRVVVTTDVMVEQRHFRRDWSTSYDVGRRAAARSLADVVAMGATPTALVVALAMPGDTDVSWVDGLADGLRDECELVGAAVVGGDMAAAAAVSIAVTALGDLGGGRPVSRSGAQVGDVVVVAGRIGFAAAGLALLQAGLDVGGLVAAHKRPVVPYAAALRLAKLGATAMIDVSDGLVADIGHIATASKLGVELASADLPLAPELVEAGLALGVDPREWVAGGGDDHAFAATLPSDLALRAVATLADLPEPVPFAQVGRVVAGEGVVFIDEAPPGAPGHDHFAR